MGNLFCSRSHFRDDIEEQLPTSIFNSKIDTLTANNTELRSMVNELKISIDDIRSKADKNGDGVVTKDELENYVLKVVSSKDEEIVVLNKIVEDLRKENILLRNKMLEMNDSSVNREQDDSQVIMIDDDIISLLAQEIIANPSTNMKYVPDVIEIQAYEKAFKAILMSIGVALKSTSFDVLGHTLKVSLRPSGKSSTMM